MASALATRYAQALVDVVTRAAGATEGVAAELASFSAAVGTSPELRSVLLSPAVALVKKKAVLAGVAARLGLSRTTLNFLYVVTDHRRLALLPEMKAAFQALLDERLGIVRADVAAAAPLAPDQQSELAARLTARTGKQVRLNTSTDPALLGGLVVRVGSTVYDGSVRGRLRALESRLKAE